MRIKRYSCHISSYDSLTLIRHLKHCFPLGNNLAQVFVENWYCREFRKLVEESKR